MTPHTYTRLLQLPLTFPLSLEPCLLSSWYFRRASSPKTLTKIYPSETTGMSLNKLIAYSNTCKSDPSLTAITPWIPPQICVCIFVYVYLFEFLFFGFLLPYFEPLSFPFLLYRFPSRLGSTEINSHTFKENLSSIFPIIKRPIQSLYNNDVDAWLEFSLSDHGFDSS